MIMHSNETSQSDKIEAIKLDAALTITLLKLDYEGTIFLRALNNTNGNDNIETPRLTQRQRDIIRSKDITAAEESTTENVVNDRKSDTTTEDQADVY